MPHTEASGIRIAYDEVGWGEPALLFLGGWCTNRTVFRGLVSLSSECRRVITFDWRGHGESAKPTADFGEAALVEDALAVITATKAKKIVPVALAQAGWVAIELRRRLGERIPKLVLFDWLILDAPPAFREVLDAMQSPERWRQAVDQIFAQWLHGVDIPPLEKFLHEEMGAYPPRCGRAPRAKSPRPTRSSAARSMRSRSSRLPFPCCIFTRSRMTPVTSPPSRSLPLPIPGSTWKSSMPAVTSRCLRFPTS